MSKMRAYVNNTGEDIPLESRQPPKALDPGTEVRNNPPLRKVMAEMWDYEERIPRMVKESTVWDVYNNEARKVDNELVKDWTASLNSLLVFAAIFAAVLTAFIIESKKMLEENPTEILVDITMQYFNSIGNQTRNSFTRPSFEPSFEAISINCLLFASLGASLVAALASVVALQWVADYDAAITRGGSSPEDRAKRRQFRHAGVVGWKMGEIIAALPILLYSSVILFWAGAIQWMWTLHQTVGYVVAGGTAMAVLFYASTTILAAVYVSAPFRTPLSRGLYWALGPSASTIYRVASWIPFKNILRRVALPFREARFPSFFQDSAIFQWIKKHFMPEHTSRYREDRAAGQDPTIASEALAWLAQQLPLSGDSCRRLLLCISGILDLPTNSPLSPHFHDAPWLTILDFVSEHFLQQIFAPTSLEKDYQDVGILLHCINSPFIRGKVVPDASYMRDPQELNYWTRYCLVDHGTLDLAAIRHAPMAFLLARDVPVPSLGSDSELEATWKLIKWRNSIGSRISEPGLLRRSEDIWREIFSDIGRYSPEFLESCFRHFQTWTNIFWHISFKQFDYTAMFDSIVEQSLHRDLTTGEVLELVRAFSSCLTESNGTWISEVVDKRNIIQRPLPYALAVEQSESNRAIHLGMTLLIARTVKPLIREKHFQWKKWVTLMLWISIPKDLRYFDARQYLTHDGMLKIWNENEISWINGPIQGPHVEEIAKILWQVDNGVMESLIKGAFWDPHQLRYLELLLRWAPHCHGHLTSSQHILLHLYQYSQTAVHAYLYAISHTVLVGLESIEWTLAPLNSILAMLALSDSQDLADLRFGPNIGLECAERISKIVKTVKRQPVAIVCLLTDILKVPIGRFSPITLATILVSVKQTMLFLDEESSTSFLLPLVSSIEWHRSMVVETYPGSGRYTVVFAEAQRICGLLQAKYAASLISSTTQLRLLSCARSTLVAQPAMGRLRMHVPL